jgi:hypothetical protein
MRKDSTVPAAQAASAKDVAASEHQLVAQLREAMASKDIVTMGRMLELLGTIKAELDMGKPVIDGHVRVKTEPGSGNAAGKVRMPAASGPPAVRFVRQ